MVAYFWSSTTIRSRLSLKILRNFGHILNLWVIIDFLRWIQWLRWSWYDYGRNVLRLIVDIIFICRWNRALKGWHDVYILLLEIKMSSCLLFINTLSKMKKEVQWWRKIIQYERTIKRIFEWVNFWYVKNIALRQCKKIVKFRLNNKTQFNGIFCFEWKH